MNRMTTGDPHGTSMAHRSDAMSVRDRFHAVMNFQPFDRLPVLEWATWWDLTLQRWYAEGLPAQVRGHEALCEHFGLDLYLQDWLAPTRPGLPQPACFGGPIIRNHDDYTRLLPLLYPRPAVKPERWQRWRQKQRHGAAVLWFSLDGFFWFPRRLLGVEAHLLAFYDQPDLLHRINQDLADWMLDAVEELTAIVTPDFMTFAEDMSYNHGPMLSADMFDQFMRPYYRRIVPRLHERGILALIDSDGDITTAAPWFAKAELDGVLPLERQAGVDLNVLRRDHPRMRFTGHFDKLTMSRGRAAMQREFDRLLPVASQGGVLVSCDHQTPPEVGYEQYQAYLAMFREFAFTAAGR